MTKYKIKVYTKNKNTLNNFLKFCKQSFRKSKNLLVIFNFLRKKKKKEIVTILRSPHVNKKAQKQYQRITYMSILTYTTWDEEKNLLYLKKIKNNIFPDLIIKIEKIQFTKTINNAIKKTLTNPYLIKNSKTTFFSLKQQQKNKEQQLIDYLYGRNTAIFPALSHKNLSNKNLGKNTKTSLKNLDNYGHDQQLNFKIK